MLSNPGTDSIFPPNAGITPKLGNVQNPSFISNKNFR